MLGGHEVAMQFAVSQGQEESFFAWSVVPCGKGLCHLS
jgi:hypothetical protein